LRHDIHHRVDSIPGPDDVTSLGKRI